MTNDAPRLLVALGDAGLRAAAQVLARWQEAVQVAELPSVIGVSFGPPPAGFPAESHVRLSSNVDAALERLRHESSPHLDQWLDADDWLPRWRQYAMMPRVLERLMWIDEMARGDRSALYQLWVRELRRSRGSSTILSFLIADLAEPAGSSLVADAAFLTHTLAQVEANREVKIWGYTLLPTSSAPEQQCLRAAAALREISRLMSAHDRVHGDPFPYRPPSASRIDERIWRGSLTSKLFDLWYCFDGTAQAVDHVAGVITTYLSADTYDKGLNHLINVSARTAPGRVYVGAANVRTALIPIHGLERAWTATVAAETARHLHGGFANDAQHEKTAGDIWRGLPNANQLELKLLEAQAGLHSALDWSRLFDQGFFGSASLVPEAMRETALQLRDESDFPDARRLSLDDIAQQSAALRQRVDVFRSREHQPFTRLVHGAVDRRVEFFQERVATQIVQRLNAEGVQLAVAIIGRLETQVAEMSVAARSILGSTHFPDETAVYRDFLEALRALASLCTDNPNFLERRRHLQRARIELTSAQKLGVSYLNAMRWIDYTDAIHQLLVRYQEGLYTLARSLREWQSRLSLWRQDWEAVQQQAPPVFPGEYQFVHLSDSTWERQQVARLRAKNRLPDPIWSINSSTLTVELTLGDTVLTTETGNVSLEEKASAIFVEAHRTSTLLSYMESERPDLDELAQFLLTAETPPLRFHETLDTAQEAFGRLVAPDDLDAGRRAIVSSLEARLKASHNLRPDDDSLIQRQIHDSPHQIAYTFAVERIDLAREVAAYTELKRLYKRYGDEVVSYHALAGEITATRIERQFARAGEQVVLSPAVVSVLANPDAVHAFFTAYLLDIIDYLPLPDGYNHYQFGYRLRLPETTVWLTRPLSSSLPVLWEALKAFSAWRQTELNGRYVPLPASQVGGYSYIQDRRATVVQALIPTSPTEAPDDQLRAWLERAFRQTTPSDIRTRIVEAAAECRLLTDFRVRLLDETLPHWNDVLQHELYRVGAALMDQRQAMLRVQIAEHIGSLARISG